MLLGDRSAADSFSINIFNAAFPTSAIGEAPRIGTSHLSRHDCQPFNVAILTGRRLRFFTLSSQMLACFSKVRAGDVCSMNVCLSLTPEFSMYSRSFRLATVFVEQTPSAIVLRRR